MWSVSIYKHFVFVHYVCAGVLLSSAFGAKARAVICCSLFRRIHDILTSSFRMVVIVRGKQ